MYIMCLLCNKFGKVIFLRYYRVVVIHAKCDNSVLTFPFRDLKIYYCSINQIDELWPVRDGNNRHCEANGNSVVPTKPTALRDNAINHRERRCPRSIFL